MWLESQNNVDNVIRYDWPIFLQKNRTISTATLVVESASAVLLSYMLTSFVVFCISTVANASAPLAMVCSLVHNVVNTGLIRTA